MILRLEYLSACKLMENEKDIIKILPKFPAALFDTLLQSIIYKCYLDFISNIDDISRVSSCVYLKKISIAFPETLRILLLNWPHEVLILRNKIPTLHPPYELFRICEEYTPLASQKQTIMEIDGMMPLFHIFCNKMIAFITEAVLKYVPRTIDGFSCNLKKLDVSGLGRFEDLRADFRCFSQPDKILEGIRNSSIETFGHKIEIYTDIEIIYSTTSSGTKAINNLSNINKENLNTEYGISVYFKRISLSALLGNTPATFPSDFFNILTLMRCEYIQLLGYEVDEILGEHLLDNLPRLIGIQFASSRGYERKIENLDFLSSFKHLEQASFKYKMWNNVITNMSKGLKYLDLSQCSYSSKDLECLAKSIHSDTLLQLDLSYTRFENDSEAAGLITLCQNLKHVKVLIADGCLLNTLSPKSITKLANAFNDCVRLEFLSIRSNAFNLDITNIIIDGLAQNKSLRYLSLDLPSGTSYCKWYDEADYDVVEGDELFELRKDNTKYLHNLCENFHEKINEFRHLTMYISWVLPPDEENWRINNL